MRPQALRALIAIGVVGVLALAVALYAQAFDPGLASRAGERLGLSAEPGVATVDGVAEVRVDARAAGTPISPLIYGVAFADTATLQRLGASVDRWGGNTASRYNWVAGSWNAARDWEFRNMPAPSSDQFVADALAAGARPLVTIPTLGWVARDSSNATASTRVPSTGGPATTVSGAIAGYDPEPNRSATSVRSLARKDAPFSDPAESSAAVYQDEWVHHLVDRFGPTGVSLYAADNEPDAWAQTHTDVHPAEMGYDDMAANFEEYATAIKAQNAGAAVVGPELCCWTSLFYSALDRGSDNFRTHADRNAHGGAPFLQWWLQQVARQDRAHGERSLDLLSVHFYPQASGVVSDASDPATRALRVRSVRGLWDPRYTDESWIDDQVQLIPRLKGWIAGGYPGTGLAITEYSFGGEHDASGAVAQAEALGIFGVQGVSLACTWTHPGPDTPAGAAFRLFRNFDGAGSSFGDLSLPATAGGPIRAFAARHSGSGEIDVIVANESTGDAQRLRVSLSGAAALHEVYLVDPGSSVIRRVAAPAAALTLAPLGLALLRFSR